jgi:hypothetical protein
MRDVKKVRIQVCTVNNRTYVGDFVVTPRRQRVSDEVNEDARLFISLTDVLMDDKDRIDFVAINKNHIESIIEIALPSSFAFPAVAKATDFGSPVASMCQKP